jgi:8-amino-7-oxononanoate synthase
MALEPIDRTATTVYLRFPVPNPIDTILAELADLESNALLRNLRKIDGTQSAEIFVDGRSALNFCSNNYLGLADHPRLLDAARAALAETGFGAGGSRLIVGNLAPHRALESRIARWKQTEAALLFNSGYQANVGVLSALCGSNDRILSDELNHASLIDGCRLSRARVDVYRHCDLDDLARRLGATPAARRTLIVTDSVFSMDGDRAPLADLRRLARAHDAFLFVDEAHAVGVLGENGAGLTAGLDVDLKMGTLSKALGGFGAYVAARRPIVDLLLNRARSFVFSTALPVPVVAAAAAAIDWLASPEGDARRARLHAVAHRFHAALADHGFPVAAEPSHIVPLRVRAGDPRRAMEAADALLARGIYAQGIRPPTVPAGTARLRFALMATHTDEHLDRAIAALVELRSLFM